ncbi:hypothetical protein OSB04_010305 [Centaurea solstitialis]|uniref:MADS-box domain-containing protein n=1 Tax=Centaurea solstitialis TaxID=347529 RepID=A0AA38TKH6_9ASTR|nr:hypothetical protein OSB04_010305 [Centaurea solstitialis]
MTMIPRHPSGHDLSVEMRLDARGRHLRRVRTTKECELPSLHDTARPSYGSGFGSDVAREGADAQDTRMTSYVVARTQLLDSNFKVKDCQGATELVDKKRGLYRKNQKYYKDLSDIKHGYAYWGNGLGGGLHSLTRRAQKKGYTTIDACGLGAERLHHTVVCYVCLVLTIKVSPKKGVLLRKINGKGRDPNKEDRENSTNRHASELTLLCDAKVSVIMLSSTDKLHEYITPSITGFERWDACGPIFHAPKDKRPFHEDLRVMKKCNLKGYLMRGPTIRYDRRHKAL